MNKILIRPAKISELKIVQDLNYKLFQHDQEFEPNLNMNWPYENGETVFEKHILDDDKCCFVAEGGGEIVGYLAGSLRKKYDYETTTWAELDNTLVKEEYRGQGIGKKLVDVFKVWAKEKKADRLFVGAYFDNSDAIKFYQSVGFENYAWNLAMNLKEEENQS